MSNDQETNAGILAGLRVLDLTRNVAGPFCTMTLGDLGADVVKIEKPGVGDDTREWRPPMWEGESATYLSFNRNKRSLALDIDGEEGRAIVKRLASRADVMVESFRVGSLARRGLGASDLRALNPRLICCSISAFGSRGPESARSAYDPTIQAYSGIMSTTGEEGRPPVRTGPATIDIGTGLWAAFGIVLALLERQRTGVGRLVEASLLETGVGWMSYLLAGYLGTGKAPGRLGSRGAIAAPYEAFRTRDTFLYVAAPNDLLFDKLCHVVGAPDLVLDSRFRTNPSRIEHREALHELLEARFLTDAAVVWEARLRQSDVPCSVIRTADQVVADPQIEALDLLMPVAHSTISDLRLVDLPISIDGQRAVRRGTPPTLGEHTDLILEELGLSRDEIRSMRRRGVVG
jgi:crotonobetainyl-CoA:carnitine CoA-transferase CaiB-like acyl-CoA transferase